MENNTLSGFEAVVGNAFGEGNNKDHAMFDASMTDEEIAKLVGNTAAPSVEEVFGKQDPKEEEDPEKDDTSKEGDTKEDDSKNTEKKDDKANTDKEIEKDKPVEVPQEDAQEGELVTGFFEAIAEQFDWKLEEDEEVPTTVEGLVDYFKEVITENSVPTYASEEMQKLDHFVQQGGRLEDYIKVSAELDYDNVDITDESNQEMLVRDLLREKGFNQNLIDSKIQKYKDVGILEDEASEALEIMQSVKLEKKEALLEEQRIQHAQMEESQQKFMTGVVDEIKALDNIRGIKIPEKEKADLLKYIFQLGPDGKSQYQKDYSQSVKNIVESAYFTKNRDKLIDDARREGNNTAMKKLKNSLRSTGAARGGKRVSSNSNNNNDIFSRVIKEMIG